MASGHLLFCTLTCASYLQYVCVYAWHVHVRVHACGMMHVCGSSVCVCHICVRMYVYKGHVHLVFIIIILTYLRILVYVYAHK